MKDSALANCNDVDDDQTSSLVLRCCACVLLLHLHCNALTSQCVALAPNGVALHLEWRWLVTMFAISSKQ